MILFGRKRLKWFILVFPAIIFTSGLYSKGRQGQTGRCGIVIVVYDSRACECVRGRGESILYQVDSLKTADSSLAENFTFQLVDRTKDRKTADAILDRCDNPIIPVVRIEDTHGKRIHEFSFEFDPVLFKKLLDILKKRAQSNMERISEWRICLSG